VPALWKLYPYEWLAAEELGSAVVDQGSPDPSKHHKPLESQATQFLEPPWKLILGNKALLPLLWEMFPNHPCLLPAFWTAEAAASYEQSQRSLSKASDSAPYGWVAKPKFGREGLGIRYCFHGLDGFAQEVERDLEELAAITSPQHFEPQQALALEKHARAREAKETHESGRMWVCFCFNIILRMCLWQGGRLSRHNLPHLMGRRAPPSQTEASSRSGGAVGRVGGRTGMSWEWE
jgi:hypothetical protein